MAEYYKNEAVTYPSIVMKQVQIIQQITSKELRDGTRTVITPIGEQIYENEDSRYSFLQAVECLGSLLSPYFDEKDSKEEISTKTLFEEFKTTYDMELVEALKEDEFLKSLSERFGIKTEKIDDRIKIDNKLKAELLAIFLNEKCKIAREMYRRLIKCFKDNDFLGSESFNEGSAGAGDAGLEADGDDDTTIEEINEAG